MDSHKKIAPPDIATMKAANVNPDTRLATDYLNIFNEYIMLAQMVADGSLEQDILAEWQAKDYLSHFNHSGFVGLKIVEQSYLSLSLEKREIFTQAVDDLIILICEHQSENSSKGNIHIIKDMLSLIEHQRDIVAALITPPKDIKNIENENKQAQIDALFD